MKSFVAILSFFVFGFYVCVAGDFPSSQNAMPHRGIYDDEPAFTSGEPSIYVEKDTLDFGRVFLGQSKALLVKVRNMGFQDLLITSTQIQPKEFTVDPSFAGVDPFDSDSFLVTFQPGSEAVFSGTLTLNNNDPQQNTYVVYLRGSGIKPPQLVLSQGELCLSVASGSIMTHVFTIQNCGASDLSFDMQPGQFALQFDGIDDYVDLGFHSMLQPVQELSVCAWIKYSSSLADHLSMSNGYSIISHGDSAYNFYIRNTGKLDWAKALKANLGYAGNYPLLLTPNEWHHVAITNDIGREVKVYIDGYDKATVPFTATYEFSKNLHVGHSDSEGLFFKGLIDEIRIYDRVLSKEEIQSSMNRPLNGSEPGLVGSWPFNESKGNKVFDLSGNGNDGTLQGGATWVADGAPVDMDWLSIEPDSGICTMGSSIEIAVQIDACNLNPGTYSGLVVLSSNDPLTPMTYIPLNLSVTTKTGLAESSLLPTEFRLDQNYPNPFNSSTTIEFALPSSGFVSLNVFNTRGQNVATILSRVLSAGNHRVEWRSENLSSGLYI